MAEINLCKCFQLITEDESDNLLNMLMSEDIENGYIAMLVVKNIMKERHDKHGNDLNHSAYSDIKKDYQFRMLSPNLFLNKTSKQ